MEIRKGKREGKSAPQRRFRSNRPKGHEESASGNPLNEFSLTRLSNPEGDEDNNQQSDPTDQSARNNQTVENSNLSFSTQQKIRKFIESKRLEGV